MPTARRPRKIKVTLKSRWPEDFKEVVYEGPERRKDPKDVKYGRRKPHIQDDPSVRKGERREKGRGYVRLNEKGTKWEMTSTRRSKYMKERTVIEE